MSRGIAQHQRFLSDFAFFDGATYGQWKIFERRIGRLKKSRQIATRSDKLKMLDVTLVKLAAIQKMITAIFKDSYLSCPAPIIGSSECLSFLCALTASFWPLFYFAVR